jgi:hypothetical protein
MAYLKYAADGNAFPQPGTAGCCCPVAAASLVSGLAAVVAGPGWDWRDRMVALAPEISSEPEPA